MHCIRHNRQTIGIKTTYKLNDGKEKIDKKSNPNILRRGIMMMVMMMVSHTFKFYQCIF